MTARSLLIPAAGLGSRLGGAVPKLLVPVGGMPMIDRLHNLYAAYVSRIVLVVHPLAHDIVAAHVRGWNLPVTCVVQEQPTGMLDAILIGCREVPPTEEVWITWCDQVAVHPATVARLAAMTNDMPHEVVMPTVVRSEPYIHFDRDAQGRIVQVLHRREGDRMPAAGEGDMGLFALSPHAHHDLLPRYALEVTRGTMTGERNFLPFLAWLSTETPAGRVVSFPAVDEVEAIGVNTPEDLRIVEAYLAARGSDAAASPARRSAGS